MQLNHRSRIWLKIEGKNGLFMELHSLLSVLFCCQCKRWWTIFHWTGDFYWHRQLSSDYGFLDCSEMLGFGEITNVKSLVDKPTPVKKQKKKQKKPKKIPKISKEDIEQLTKIKTEVLESESLLDPTSGTMKEDQQTQNQGNNIWIKSVSLRGIGRQ